MWDVAVPAAVLTVVLYVTVQYCGGPFIRRTGRVRPPGPTEFDTVPRGTIHSTINYGIYVSNSYAVDTVQ
jgi:hypothetical protein